MKAVHYLIPGTGETPYEDEYILCGEYSDPKDTTNEKAVTCKRCLKRLSDTGSEPFEK